MPTLTKQAPERRFSGAVAQSVGFTVYPVDRRIGRPFTTYSNWITSGVSSDAFFFGLRRKCPVGNGLDDFPIMVRYLPLFYRCECNHL